MNREPPSPHDDRMEREWALQEQAVRAERLGLDDRYDAKLQRYRAIAHALQQPLDEDLPVDFAHEIAREARRRAAGDMRLELYLSWTLLGVLVAMLIGLVARYGSALGQFTHIALSQPWLLALAGFFALLAASKLPHRRFG
jgi:anti-sigma factor RsiW